jgi:uncharacterized membrane protein YjjP (DUF1212 family)
VRSQKHKKKDKEATKKKKEEIARLKKEMEEQQREMEANNAKLQADIQRQRKRSKSLYVFGFCLVVSWFLKSFAFAFSSVSIFCSCQLASILFKYFIGLLLLKLNLAAYSISSLLKSQLFTQVR